MAEAILVRLSDALKMCGLKRSTYYKQVEEGLWPKPVRLGLRASAWPVRELEIICKHRIAGAEDGEIRRIVSKLSEERKHAA
jgi:prophage regulatory protein